MRGSVGVFLENVREVVFVHKQRRCDCVKRKILRYMFGNIINGFRHSGIWFSQYGEIVAVLQKILSQQHKQSFYSLLVFDVRAEVAGLRNGKAVQNMADFVRNRAVANKKSVVFVRLQKTGVQVGFCG